MSGPQPTSTGRCWADRAVEYATHFGWEVVPIGVESGLCEENPDPVLEHLGASLLVDDLEAATSDPDEIRQLGRRFSDAEIGARTGPGSDLLAVEIKEQNEKSPFRQRVEEVAGGAFRTVAPNREYLLFPYPELAKPLPTLTEREDAVLHGQGSVVYLAWRRYEWHDPSLDADSVPSRRVAEVLLALFGLEDHLPPSADERERRENQAEERSDLVSSSNATAGVSANRESGPRFRSGDRLKPSAGGSHSDRSWTVSGGLTVLTGQPKIAGKSTWAVNLAAHRAAGRSFLSKDFAASDVVLLADTPPSTFRRLLRRVGVLDDGGLARLHVLHPSDVQRLNWYTTLVHAFRHAVDVGADLLVIDSLDRYVRLKEGGSPTQSEEVVHVLTAEAPADCAVLGVKSTDCRCQESITRTVERLGLLGRTADAILRLDNVSTDSDPSLRRLRLVSRTASSPASVVCALRGRRYERVRRGEGPAGLPRSEAPLSPGEDLDRLLPAQQGLGLWPGGGRQSTGARELSGR